MSCITDGNSEHHSPTVCSRLIRFLNSISHSDRSSHIELSKFVSDLLPSTSGRDYSGVSSVLKDHGWSGERFPDSLDKSALLHALINHEKQSSSSARSDVEVSIDITKLSRILSFLPEVLVNHIKKEIIRDNTSMKKNNMLKFHGACMLVDVSGFSKFSAWMCSNGSNGLDDLRHATNGFLGYYVEHVYEYEGDVIAFAGDALVTIFEAKTELGSLAICESCYRALQCAHVLRKHKTDNLSTHIAVSCGEMSIALLGGHQNEWVFLLNGKCVSELSSCIEDALSQEVASTRQCFEQALRWDATLSGVPKEKRLTSKLRTEMGNVLLGRIGIRRTVDPPPPLTAYDTDSSVFNKVVDVVSNSRMPYHDNTSFHSRNYETTLQQMRYQFVGLKGRDFAVSAISGITSTNLNGSYPKLGSIDTISNLSRLGSSTMSLTLSNNPSTYPASTVNLMSRTTSNRSSNASCRNVVMNAHGVNKQTSRSHLRVAHPLGDYDDERLSEPSVFDDVDSDPDVFSDVSSNADPHELKKNRTKCAQLNNFSSNGSDYDDDENDGDVIDSKSTATRSTRRVAVDFTYTTMSKSILLQVSKLIPKSIIDAICYTDTLEWISELRLVTTMFISLDSYDPLVNEDPSSLQEYFYMAQEVLHETGAYLRQFIVDDKGCVIVAMWGVPTFTYLNNCSRAVYCAASIHKRTKTINCRVSIGLATGLVFCGIIGCIQRSDYAGIGTDVNMAARLMGKANGRILVDNETYQSLNPDTKKLLQQAETMQLKGTIGPTIPYLYSSNSTPSLADSDIQQTNFVTTLPQVMQDVLVKQIEKLGHSSDTTVTSAEPSFKASFTIVFNPKETGKSPAISFFQNLAIKCKYRLIYISCDETYRVQASKLVREIFESLIGFDYFSGLDMNQNRSVLIELVEKMLQNDDPSVIINTVYRLEHLLGIRNPSNKVTALQRRGSANDDRLFYRAVRYLLNNSCAVLIIENVHFCDDLSWKELFLLKTGTQLNLSVLLTAESSEMNLPRYYSVLDYFRESPNEMFSLNVDEDVSPRWAFMQSISSNSTFYDDVDVDKDFADIMLKQCNSNVPKSYLRAIFEDPDTVTLELRRLNFDEVEIEMRYWIAPELINARLVELVYSISYGHPYWCKALAKHLSDNGSDDLYELESSINRRYGASIPSSTKSYRTIDYERDNAVKSRKYSRKFSKSASYRNKKNTGLQQMVLVHFERLSAELQLICKHASVIGCEFNEAVLREIIPPHFEGILGESLNIMVQSGFICCCNSYERRFCFPNALVESTLYQLFLPSDSSRIHLQIADAIERMYANRIEPYWAILGYHYQRADESEKAFKYQFKAAQYAISRTEYREGLVLLTSASQINDTLKDLTEILVEIDSAVAGLELLCFGKNKSRLYRSTSRYINNLMVYGHNMSRDDPNWILVRYTELQHIVKELIETQRPIPPISKGCGGICMVS